MKFLKDFIRGFLWLAGLAWGALGITLHGLIVSFLLDKDKEMMIFILVCTILWWPISVLFVILLSKWKKYKAKEIEKEFENARFKKYNEKNLSEEEIKSSYFENGVLIKDSCHPYNRYIDIKSGFDRIFDSFDKSYVPCDLGEISVREDNIDYVLDSLQMIYEKSDQIMEKCYGKIYDEIIHFFEDVCEKGTGLKKEFNLDYVKKNWRVYSLNIYDEAVCFFIGIDASDDPEADSYYQISVSVDYATQEPEVSFDIVW